MNDFFKQLEEEIKICDNVIIMGHKSPDLDCLGSALGLYITINKPCYIFKSEKDTVRSILKSYELISDMNINFINKSNYKNIISKQTLLIAVDLHKEQLLEYSEILNEIENVAIIDHHIIGSDKMASKYEYINPQASSTIEIIAEYIQQKNISIPSLIATIMLAGIDIDTNSYNTKVTETTYKISAFLMTMKADNQIKQYILKENKEEYIKRAQQIANSYLIDNKIICPLDDLIYNPSYLARLAEDLLRFDGVDASFTIGYLEPNKIGISARSSGKVDVETYMRLLGGGGHKCESACQLQNENLEDATKKLLKVLKEKQ